MTPLRWLSLSWFDPHPGYFCNKCPPLPASSGGGEFLKLRRKAHVQLCNQENARDTTWFTHDRFGMFIHWGLYAMPARHEWVKTRERMTDDHYDRYFRHFDPDLYDPGSGRAWPRRLA